MCIYNVCIFILSLSVKLSIFVLDLNWFYIILSFTSFMLIVENNSFYCVYSEYQVYAKYLDWGNKGFRYKSVELMFCKIHVGLQSRMGNTCLPEKCHRCSFGRRNHENSFPTANRSSVLPDVFFFHDRNEWMVGSIPNELAFLYNFGFGVSAIFAHGSGGYRENPFQKINWKSS